VEQLERLFSREIALLFLLSTGVRRGELLGVQWSDINFDLREITIRRSITVGEATTPKSGRSRKIQMTESLAAELFNLLARRSRESLARGWADIPEWIFCSTVGSHIEERNFSRSGIASNGERRRKESVD
jgi:integrase